MINNIIAIIKKFKIAKKILNTAKSQLEILLNELEKRENSV